MQRFYCGKIGKQSLLYQVSITLLFQMISQGRKKFLSSTKIKLRKEMIDLQQEKKEQLHLKAKDTKNCVVCFTFTFYFTTQCYKYAS